MIDDTEINRLLDTNTVKVAPQRVWMVRRAILLHAAAHPVRRYFIFGFHPAFAFATVLFGLVLGFSMPQVVQHDTSIGFLDVTSQTIGGETLG